MIRLNDLHCLDLETMQWSLVMADTGNGQASICEQNFMDTFIQFVNVNLCFELFWSAGGFCTEREELAVCDNGGDRKSRG